jgi:hypothetical protein
MKRSARLARHYIRAADLRAVYVASVGRHVKIGMTRDPDGRARDLKRTRAKLYCVFWFASSADAAAVIRTTCGEIPGVDRGAIANPGEVKAALMRIAKELRLSLTENSVVQQRAAAVVADIDARVAAMQASGHLRGMNAEYRAGRAEAARRGISFPSYGDHLERYKLKMLYELARLTR